MQSLMSNCPTDLKAKLGTICIGKPRIKVSTRQLLEYMSKHDDEWEDKFYKNLNSRLLTFLDKHEKKWAEMSIEERTERHGGVLLEKTRTTGNYTTHFKRDNSNMDVAVNVEIVEDEEELQDLDALLERENNQPDIEEKSATQQTACSSQQQQQQQQQQQIETPQTHNQVIHFTHHGENANVIQLDKDYLTTIVKPPGIQHREFMLHFQVSQDNPNRYNVNLLSSNPPNNEKMLKCLCRKIKSTKYRWRNFKRTHQGQRYTELV